MADIRTIKQLNDRITDLHEEVAELLEQYQKGRSDLVVRFAKQESKLNGLRRLKDVLTQVEALAPAASQTSIDSFFRAVGRGMLEAQRDLDEQTSEYLASQPPLPPPMMFSWYLVSAG